VIGSQIEAPVTVDGQQVWMVDTTNAEFAGKTLTNVSGSPGASPHATSDGVEFYGTAGSIAPGIADIAVYGASWWLGNNFLYRYGVRQPLSSTSRVASHSWAGGGVGALSNETLRRLDWVIENDDFIHVVAQGSPSPLLASALNVIAVGNTDGAFVNGTVEVDPSDPNDPYVAGRVHPNVVIPADNISLAAPRVAAAAALLVELGNSDPALSTDPSQTSYTNRGGVLVRNAERAEVIKAALMAGADRVTRNTTSGNLALYRGAGYQSANGLDSRYGAGQINIYNSYHIIARGEQNSAEDGGPGSGTAPRGFDWDRYFGGSSGSNTTGTYALPVSATPRLLTAALVWHLDIDGGTALNFDPDATLRDLALSVVDVTGAPVTVFTSQSTVDNTENAWRVVPANAQYMLQVSVGSGSAFDYDYAVAWQLMNDADGDGAHDGQDNCIEVANGPIVADSGDNSQRDTNGDGYGNVCDADLNNSGLVTSRDYYIMRSVLNTSNADADLDGSGLVTTIDYGILRDRLNMPPGPSAYAP
jgi:hypothetical protein